MTNPLEEIVHADTLAKATSQGYRTRNMAKSGQLRRLMKLPLNVRLEPL